MQLKSHDARAAHHGRARLPPVPPDRLEIEITEAVLIHDDETAWRSCISSATSACGSRSTISAPAISSLSYLKRFPFDKIKIDRCFVSDIEVDGSADDRAGGGQHRDLAQHDHDRGRRRNRTAKAACCKLGCTQMQGYLFSAPQACSPRCVRCSAIASEGAGSL